MFKKFLQKKTVVEKKSHITATQESFAKYYTANYTGGKTLTPSKALFYYTCAAPVSTAIDLINDEFKTLDLAVNTDGKITTDDEIIAFLQQPNDDMVLEDFLETMGAFFLVTNEVYIIATGPSLNQAPAELIIVSPELVSIKKSTDGFINQIDVQTRNSSRLIFKRDENQFRFFTPDNSAEIWQIKGFNPKQTGRGQSKLTSVSYEIEQYLETGIHNLSLLTNGLSTSGLLSAPEALSDDQFERLKEQMSLYQEGAANAGKHMLLDGGLTWQEMGINPKDMDFMNLKKDVSTAIFNRYKVPLPLINPDKMTLANMDSAKLNLYDNAVLPFAARMFAELTKFLAPRFKMPENQVLVPLMDNITALKTRTLEEMKLKKELGIFRIDELRAEIDAESIGPGGDIVYIPNNMVPAGTPPEATPTNNEVAKTTRESFREIMKSQLDVKGNRSFTDEDIERIADEEDL